MRTPTCPYCGSDNFDTELYKDHVSTIEYNARCNDCLRSFQYVEYFEFAGWETRDEYTETLDWDRNRKDTDNIRVVHWQLN